MCKHQYSAQTLISVRKTNITYSIDETTISLLKSVGIFRKTKRGSRGRGNRRSLLQNRNNSVTTSTECSQPKTLKVPTQSSRDDSHTPEGSSLLEPSITDISSIKAVLCNVRSMNNKTAIIHDLIERSDLVFLTETWLTENAGPTLEAAVPINYSVLHCSRKERRGGGVALCFRSALKIRPLTVGPTNSFECLGVQLLAEKNLNILLIYRPPGEDLAFLKELVELLCNLTLEYPRWIVLGDFNTWVDVPSSQLGRELPHALNELGFSQAINSATHKKGHTLDLIFHIGLSIATVEINPVAWSDHHTIHFSLSLTAAKHQSKNQIKYRSVKGLTPQHIRDNLSFDELANSSLDPDTLVLKYNKCVSSTFDTIAPLRTKHLTPHHHAQWFDNSIKELKKQGRKLERLWRKSKSQEDKQVLILHLKNYQKVITSKKSSFLTHEITNAVNKPAQLFCTVENLCNPACQKPTIQSSKDLCEKFAQFFSDKVSAIRSTIQLTAVQPSTVPENINRGNVTPWSNFKETDEEITSSILLHLRQTTCDLDPGPTQFMLKCPDLFIPVFSKIINSSLQSGIFPTTLKEAIIRPLLKKPSLDPDALTSFRPVSNLPFLGKAIEKAVYHQLEAKILQNNMYDPFQSGFRKHHSTETALIQVCNHLLMARDRGECSILMLLDLSAAFDTVDHDILISRLQEYCGIDGIVLQWFQSFLSGRTQRVSMGPFVSSAVPLKYGVPQGSILSPLLFTIYMLPLGKLIQKHGLTYHCYADDTQLYLSFKPGVTDPTPTINSCLAELQQWMSDNWLRLNADKTEILFIGGQRMATKQLHLQSAPLGIGGTDLHSSEHVRSLGVLIDGDLNFRTHISAVVKSSHFHLRNIAKIKHLIPPEDLPTLVHAFITSRLDYCNALYTGLPNKDLYRLQLVQNTAARLLTNLPRHCHIKPALHALHWLPIKWRILFKIGLLTFKSLHNLGPVYMKEMLQLRRNPCNLRSTGSNNLVIPRVHLKTFGHRAFCHAAPTLWNSLPQQIRTAPSLDVFKSRLKTHLFSLAFAET